MPPWLDDDAPMASPRASGPNGTSSRRAFLLAELGKIVACGDGRSSPTPRGGRAGEGGRDQGHDEGCAGPNSNSSLPRVHVTSQPGTPRQSQWGAAAEAGFGGALASPRGTRTLFSSSLHGSPAEPGAATDSLSCALKVLESLPRVDEKLDRLKHDHVYRQSVLRAGPNNDGKSPRPSNPMFAEWNIATTPRHVSTAVQSTDTFGGKVLPKEVQQSIKSAATRAAAGLPLPAGIPTPLMALSQQDDSFAAVHEKLARKAREAIAIAQGLKSARDR